MESSSNSSNSSNWSDVCLAAQNTLDSKIPPEWRIDPKLLAETPRNVIPLFASTGILSSKELEITESEDATFILNKIHTSIWSAEEVTTAFCKRAAIAHQLVRCLMDIDFVGAIESARKLDTYHKNTGQIVGPLHGLPISFKDLTSVKDMKYSMGLVAWAHKVSDRDAPIVEVLRRAGAIVYVKTTMPQTGMAIETVSNLWGRTLNPVNTLLTCGGSSGGEGALIACFGSPLGIGTDIGGSVRAPASFNGLYGIKPTSKRGTYKGNNNNSTSSSPIWSAMGPIGRSVRDLELICRILTEAEPWLIDPRVAYKQWSTHPPPDKIAVGIMRWDGVVMPHPPIQRALNMAAESLRTAGHEVVEFQPYDHDRGLQIVRRLYYATGGKEIMQAIKQSGEPLIKHVERSISDAKAMGIDEFFCCCKERENYQNEYLAHWNSTAFLASNGKPVDAILLPSHVSASFPHDVSPYAAYFSIWNLLDYPAAIIPITKADKTIDVFDKLYQPQNSTDERVHQSYDADLYDGAPVSLQLVGRPLAEEELLAVAQTVDRALKRRR